MKHQFVLLTILALALAHSVCPSSAPDVTSCTASFNGTELIIRNTRIERRWKVVNGGLSAISLRDLQTGSEWLKPSSSPLGVAKGKSPLMFSATRSASNVLEPPSLTVELLTKNAPKRGYRFRLFPGVSGISVQRIGMTQQDGAALTAEPARDAEASGIEAESKSTDSKSAFLPDALEILDLAPQHLKLTQVSLFDQTDVHNELVSEREWLLHPAENLRLQGNIFTIEASLTGNGLIFLKEAPLPHARPEKSDRDFEYQAAQHRITLTGNSIGPSGSGYRVVTLTYSGGRTGITRALQEYQRQIRPYVPGRDGMFVSNTWGDRSRDARINDAFMRKEVAAGSRLGVDVIQIDDGWQQGRSKNSAQAGGVWNGFWAADPGFWNVNRERFPQGLEPVIQLARQQGMGFGLWFAPDSSNDFANWERDAARLLELHRTLQINYFKIDGVKATSKLAEARLRSLFDRVLENSGGHVVFDLDVTAEIRPGYFGAMNVGPLFVENRYTDRRGYWPHQTLRNLWQLAHYVDPLRLRIEFLNNARNATLYGNDVLAPSEYSPAYLFATTMVANPLGWFEISGLPPRYFEQLGPMVRTWKKERDQWYSGSLFPIGTVPDGVAWTGFASVDAEAKKGYLLCFRERNQADHWSEPIPVLLGRSYKLELLTGDGSGSVLNGKIEVEVPHPLGFAWFRLVPTK